MTNKTALLLIILFVAVKQNFSQEKKEKKLPSVAIGLGVLSFDGDIGNGLKTSSLSRIKAGYNMIIEQRFNNFLGASISGMFGKLSAYETNTRSNLNFESKIIQTDLNLVFHFDNDLFLSSNSEFAPYIFVGVGFLKFDSYCDCKDKNGNTYNYWSDGTIRTLSENNVNASSAKITQRDYSFETKLYNPTTDYARYTISAPIGVGLKFKLTDYLSTNLGASYYFTFSDYIDNTKNGVNDKYLYTNFSLQYNIHFTSTNDNTKLELSEFASLSKLDTDNDGVIDDNDICPGTLKNVRVDAKGCPLDKDDDGIPDYKDLEPASKKGALVDENGITQTDKIIAQRQAKKDSLATERSEMFFDNPSLYYLKDVESKSIANRNNNENETSKIPNSIRVADRNNDGFISIEEIFTSIEDFFDGDTDYTVEKLNELIDYFFAQ